jgi:hypothetical protein
MNPNLYLFRSGVTCNEIFMHQIHSRGRERRENRGEQRWALRLEKGKVWSLGGRGINWRQGEGVGGVETKNFFSNFYKNYLSEKLVAEINE